VDISPALLRATACTSFEGYVETLAASGLNHIAGWQQDWYLRLAQSYIDQAIAFSEGYPGLAGVQINMPPRHGKSTLVADLAPCYAATRSADAQVMLMTYSRDLSARTTDSILNICKDPAHMAVSPVRVGRATSLEVDAFGQLQEKSVQGEAKAHRIRFLRDMGDGRVSKTRGYFLATSPGGGATGWGYNVGVMDDLIKNPQEAESPAHRRGLEDVIKSCFFTRRTAYSAMIQILTRWHKLDIGYTVPELWKMAGLPYAVISLPALATDHPAHYDPRKPGEPLDTKRFGLKFYETQRALLDNPDMWEALYQQNPQLTTGAQFEDHHWGRYDPDELRSNNRVERVIMSIDPTMGGGGGSSYNQIDVAAAVSGEDGLELWKLTEDRGKWDIAETFKRILAAAELWKPDDILIENAAAGGSLYSLLKGSNALGPEIGDAVQGTFGHRFSYKIHKLAAGGRPVRVHLLPHGGEAKALRVETASPYVTTGLCKLPGYALGHIKTDWVEPHLEEFRDWPQGSNDDRLDTWSQLCRWAATELGLRPRWSALASLLR
jgi:hypothetical protein